MSNILFNLSEKIDTDTVAVLRAVKEVADSLNIAFFVVGATARDIILEHCYNVAARRMTMDVDIGVEVADWNQFGELLKTLLSTGKFSETQQKQRLLFNNRAIDIVPFGPVADEDKKVSWPPEHEIFMSLLGFEEAYKNSMTVRLSDDPILDIQLPTLPGLAIMKLISWDEKYPGRSKDAEDLLFIMNNYHRAGIEDRLYGEKQNLLTEEDFDIQIAGIRLLGCDIASIADPDTIERVMEILTKETREQDQYHLVVDMIRGSIDNADKFEEVLNLIKKLNKGILEGLNNS